jgi:hypothetical protein
MLKSGEYATIREIANVEKINETYVGRVLRLTLLAPDIVEAIMGGRQPAEITLAWLMRRFPVGWRDNWRMFRPGCRSLDRLDRSYNTDAASRHRRCFPSISSRNDRQSASSPPPAAERVQKNMLRVVSGVGSLSQKMQWVLRLIAVSKHDAIIRWHAAAYLCRGGGARRCLGAMPPSRFGRRHGVPCAIFRPATCFERIWTKHRLLLS